jgi:quinol-cytochrome oxidoreductase complex cytochrome b subunit
MSDLTVASSAPKLTRAAVVSLGVCALLIGFVIAPIFPFVVVGVCGWWLYDDLVRNPSRRPGWLGITSLAVFTLVALSATAIVTILATNADCGADLFASSTDGDSTFDRACADRERWQSVVAVSLALVVCGLAAFGVRRSDATQRPGAVVTRTFGVSAVVIVAINFVIASL